MASQREPVISVHVDIRSLQPAQETRVEVHQADHIEPVVLERRFEEVARTHAQVIEIGIRHERAWEWIVALVTEHPLLDKTQVAHLEAMAVERAHERQEVDVRRMRKLPWHARHDPPRTQHGEIERSTVERGEAGGRPDLFAQRVQKRRFHPRFRQEELGDAQAAVDRPGDGGRENVRAGAPCKPGGFRVDVRDRARVGVERRQRDHFLPESSHPVGSRHLFEAGRQLVTPLRSRSRRRA